MPYLSRDDGAQIYYTLDGPEQAPALIFSNSLGTNAGMWAFQVAALKDRFRIVRYDTRGHGLSSAPSGDYDFAMLAGDTAAVLDHVGITKATFCGISMGGMTGLQLALSRPDLVEGLVLCNTAARIGSAEGWAARIAAVGEQTLAAMAPALVVNWLSDPFRQKHPGLVQVLCDMLARTSDTGYCANCAALRDGDLRDRLSQITAPTLVISGAADKAATTAQGAELASGIAGAEHVDLPTSHISNWEAPEAFTACLVDFLTRKVHP